MSRPFKKHNHKLQGNVAHVQALGMPSAMLFALVLASPSARADQVCSSQEDCAKKAAEYSVRSEKEALADKREESAKWYYLAERARDQGCYDFDDGPVCYHQAQSGARLDNPSSQLPMYVLACWTGYAKGCMEAGTMLLHGAKAPKPRSDSRWNHSVKPDPEMARDFFGQACALHDAAGCALASLKRRRR